MVEPLIPHGGHQVILRSISQGGLSGLGEAEAKVLVGGESVG